MKMLWAVRKENEDWQEEIITTNETVIRVAKEWAEKNGFNRFRIAEITDEKPDFVKCLNI